MQELLASLRAAAEPTRLRLLALAARGAFCVMEFTEILGQSQPRLSRHLRLLAEAGLLERLREGANVIGRGQDAQFRLPDTGVSRRHLEIRWDGQVALLSDLNSTNGTTVNNAPVQEWQLADGDVVRLGHSEIVVHIH